MALTKAHNRMIEGASVNVKDFGAVGDGVTDDTAAIQAAINAHNNIYFPNGTYFVGTVSDPTTLLFQFQLKDNVSITSDSAEITFLDTTTADTHVRAIFDFNDCNNVSIFGQLTISSDIVATGHFNARAINITNTTVDTSGVYIQNLIVNGCNSGVRFGVTNDSILFQTRHIVIDKLYVKDSKYGLIPFYNGSFLVAKSVYTDNVVRGYYVSGVNNHDVNIETHNHPYSSADVLINTYARDTTDIKVRYRPIDNLSYQYLVRLSHTSTTAPDAVAGPTSGKKIENIYIDYDDNGTTSGTTGSNNWGIICAEEDTTGLTRTTSSHIMTNINVSGSFSRYYGISSVIALSADFSGDSTITVPNTFFDASTSALAWVNGNARTGWRYSQGGGIWIDDVAGTWEGDAASGQITGQIITPVFAGTWVDTAGLYAFTVFRSIDSIVTITGAITGGSTANALAFTLPVGCRPTKKTSFIAWNAFDKTSMSVVAAQNGEFTAIQSEYLSVRRTTTGTQYLNFAFRGV